MSTPDCWLHGSCCGERCCQEKGHNLLPVFSGPLLSSMLSAQAAPGRTPACQGPAKWRPGPRNPSSVGEPGWRGTESCCDALDRPRGWVQHRDGGQHRGSRNLEHAAARAQGHRRGEFGERRAGAGRLVEEGMGADTVGTSGWGTDRGPEDQGSRGAPSRSPGAAARDPHRGRLQGGPALAHLAPRCCAQSSRSGGSSQASSSMASAGGALGRGRRRGPAVAGARKLLRRLPRRRHRRVEREGARRGSEGGRSAEPGAAPPRTWPRPRAGRPAPQLGPPRLPGPAPSASPSPRAAVPRGSGTAFVDHKRFLRASVQRRPRRKTRVDATSRCRPDACGPTGAAGPPP